ncbi:MAG: TerC/Alx family metal homeostasis membrane protein [Bacteroidetes bacterium]|nr:TerC/Alx family metal homeostasis membrane protein [Bacteroidota bacterium]MBS1974205.1 TerC/Alx family metal homeostasis membrane protein [Bacteroidota bacterium]
MDPSQLTYLIFGIILMLALIFDLGLLSRKGASVTIQKALWQTVFWVCLALAFFGFLWYEKGHKSAVEYISAYLMEWSLSIDNIFVFILIFSFFGVSEKFYGRVLLIGILMAVILRIIFITVGVALVNQFHWLLYLFGAILVYTGITMYFSKHDAEVNLEDNKAYKFLKRFFPLTSSDGNGKLTIMQNGKKMYTSIFVVIILLATTDVIFAIDSIPAVFGITQDRLVIYTSNIFAVLGLRSLFFLLRGAVNKFKYLPQGIAMVLVFIGAKMLIEMFKITLPVYVSLLVIVVCIGSAMAYSAIKNPKQ